LYQQNHTSWETDLEI